MIISVNSRPDINEFKSLMKRVDSFLNSDARKRPLYYAEKSRKSVGR